jgi:ParB family chromosome partitioning protein
MSRKRGLGRGLDSLIATPGEEVTSLPVDRLAPNRMQPRTRMDEAALAELADSIRAQGVLQPIVVTPEAGERYSIIAGERRWRASQLAGLDTVPVVVREVKDERELLELALVENLQRSDLNPVEEAEAYQQLRKDFSLSQEQIGQRVGKSRPAIANALRLLNLPDEVQEMLRQGQLTAGQARPLLGLERQAALRLAQRAAAEGLTARQLEALAQPPASKPRPKAKKRKVEVHAAAAEETLTRHLQTKVEIRRRRGGAGEVRLHFHSEEELMRLYDLLMQRGERG